MKKDLDQHFSGKLGVIAQVLMRTEHCLSKLPAAFSNDRKYFINTFWGFRNFGDLLTPFFFEKIGRIPINCPVRPKASVLMVGSILDGLTPSYRGIVFGAGALNQNKVHRLPKSEIVSVRGELTKRALGLKDAFLGDPGLMMSSYYQIDCLEKKYDVSVIRHYDDPPIQVDKLYSNESENPRINFIDVFSPPELIAKQVAQSQLIISSSLHGLVFSDSYKVPSICVNFGNRSIEKYIDYFSAFGNDRKIVTFDDKTSLNELRKAEYNNFEGVDHLKLKMRDLFESRFLV